MYFFVNDYNDIASPEVLEALLSVTHEYNQGYGFDKHSANARNLIKNAIGDENADIHFIPGGTGANILGLACGMNQQNSVISVKSGHIEGHESGSIEATGIKIETIDSPNGKLSPALIEEKLSDFTTEYVTVPKKVYISNTTELGEVYTKAEIIEIYDFCKENDMYLFIDGARLSHALASEVADYDLTDLTNMCDIFYLGGTKNGLPFGEALVIVNDDLKNHFINLQKQKGQLMAKGFVPAIMFERMFADDMLYMANAKKAYEAAKKLALGFKEKGYSLAYPFESNQVFVKLTYDEIHKFKEIAAFEISGRDGDYNIARFVTSYRTIDDDIEGFLSEL